MLELDGMITRQHSDSRTTTIILSNYAKYQDKRDTTATAQRQQSDHHKDSTATAQRQQKPVSSEYMKEYTEYTEGESVETKRGARFEPPTLAEVLQFISEERLPVDGRRFWNNYEATGWYMGLNKMKDWKAAVRKWAAENEQDRKQRAAPAPKKFDNFEPRETQGSAMDEYIKRLEEGYD